MNFISTNKDHLTYTSLVVNRTFYLWKWVGSGKIWYVSYWTAIELHLTLPNYQKGHPFSWLYQSYTPPFYPSLLWRKIQALFYWWCSAPFRSIPLHTPTLLLHLLWFQSLSFCGRSIHIAISCSFNIHLLLLVFSSLLFSFLQHR